MPKATPPAPAPPAAQPEPGQAPLRAFSLDLPDELGDEMPPVVDHHEFRELAFDLQGSHNALRALSQLLQHNTAAPMDEPMLAGLAVLLEGTCTRLSLALDRLAEVAQVLQIEGVPTTR